MFMQLWLIRVTASSQWPNIYHLSTNDIGSINFRRMRIRDNKHDIQTISLSPNSFTSFEIPPAGFHQPDT